MFALEKQLDCGLQASVFPDCIALDLAFVEQPPVAPTWLDFAEQAAPHVPFLQAVLQGDQYRYKFSYDNTVLIFDHGCLMGRVFYEGRFYALPPMALDDQGQPFLFDVPVAQRPALAEFCSLPKGLLLFYFSVLKAVFEGRPLSCRKWDRENGETRNMPMPKSLQPWLFAVGWDYQPI